MRLSRCLAALLWLPIAVAGCSRSGGGGSGGFFAPAASGSASSGSTGTTGGNGGAASTDLLAGAAAVDIAPLQGTPLGGYGSPPRRKWTVTTAVLNLFAVTGNYFDPDPSDHVVFFEPSQGVHDPVRSKAIVLESNGKKVAIVGLDAIACSQRLRNDVARYALLLGIPNDGLLICATHTHAGPAAMSDQRLWQLAAMDAFDQRVYDHIVDRVRLSLLYADAARVPARLGIAADDLHGASQNRRGHPGLYDPQVGVIYLEKLTGEPLAVAYNFAVHGTSLGSDNMLFSADNMGFAERFVEQQLGGNGVLCVHLNGAEGDVRPVGGAGSAPPGDFQSAQNCGERVGQKVLDIVKTITPSRAVDLNSSYEEVAFPQPYARQGCSIQGALDFCSWWPSFAIHLPMNSDWISTRPGFQAIRINQTVLATVPGEPITNVGLAIKARGQALGFARTFVVGLANDHIGYIADKQEYYTGSYEAMATMFGEGTADLVVTNCEKQMLAVK